MAIDERVREFLEFEIPVEQEGTEEQESEFSRGSLKVHIGEHVLNRKSGIKSVNQEYEENYQITCPFYTGCRYPTYNQGVIRDFCSYGKQRNCPTCIRLTGEICKINGKK